MQRQICLTSDIHRIKRAANLELGKGRAQFVLCCGLQEFEGFRRVGPDLDRGVIGGNQ